MTKTAEEIDLRFEIEKMKYRIGKLERYYHSNLKYIKYLFVEIDQLKKDCGNDTA